MTIELTNVSRWYGNVVAVNDITMSIGPGVTGLLGPNGAGKSTIMHMIAGFLPPSRGELTVAGGHSWRFRAIRRLMTSRPHVFTVRSADDRRPAGSLIGKPAVTAVELTGTGLQVRTSDYGAFCRDIAVLARDNGIRLREVQPTDESLESVFAYLVAD